MALGAILGFGIPAIAGFLANKLFGGGKKGGKAAGAGGKTLPGGGTVANIPKYSPEVQKKLEAAIPQILEEFKKAPEKFPELADIFRQAQEVLPPMELEKIIPGLSELSPIPEMPPAADLKELDFAPIEAQARQRFTEETIPTLAERFTTLTGGGQRSGAFERQQAKAATDLETNLAALRATMEPEYAMKKAEYGLQRGKLGAVLGQLGLQRGQTQNALALQRGQMLANLGLSQRQQDLQGAQLGLSRAQMALQPQQFRQSLLANILSGGVASPFQQVVQAPQPTLMQGLAPGIGQGLGGLLGGLGQAGAKWLFS